MTRAPSDSDRKRLGALIDRVAADRGLARADLAAAGRHADRARLRFAVVWLARTTLDAGWGELGRQLGRDPATMIHAFRRAETLRTSDADFRDLSNRLLADPLTPRSE